ncbi:Sulfite exporter TauE/SafE family protein 3 [Camellia lanceoleosa]|uniref:Sulfite exporter TauE/SafE family protein 3 n=1 Tax=Camellia lanceoleosa TaxID=1840588 RepID=A0ACC0FNC7_9ERIC|nr:Sulfite exporter TauE/SafE family protein 3 [Camellia lanceoleosa]
MGDHIPNPSSIFTVWENKTLQFHHKRATLFSKQNYLGSQTPAVLSLSLLSAQTKNLSGHLTGIPVLSPLITLGTNSHCGINQNSEDFVVSPNGFHSSRMNSMELDQQGPSVIFDACIDIYFEVEAGMIMGAAISSAYSNLKLRHPTLDMPVIDYDLALLVQPMLMLGISIGVAFNVIFADWMVTVLLIILFVGNGHDGAEYKLLPDGPAMAPKRNPMGLQNESIIENVYWKELELLFFVWVAFLALQITKIPVSVAVTLHEAIGLYKGKRQISSRGDTGTNLKAHQLILYCSCGVLAGVVGGLLGLGGGFILGPLFLELGVPPQSQPEESQSQTQTDGSQTQSQVKESLVGSQVTKVTKVMKKKLAVERRMVMRTSHSTPLHASQDVQGSAVSSNTNTPLQGQIRWRGRVVYNANAVKSPLGATMNAAETKYLENE